MIRIPAPRTRLYLATAGAIAVLLLMAAVTWYSNSVSNAALNQVIEQNVKPLLALQAIDRHIKEVRFRIAGVILDQMPAPGSRQHLAEARAAIPHAWEEYGRATRAATDDEKDAYSRLERGLADLSRLFDKLDRAYASSEDRRELTVILEEDWPAVTTEVIKPIDKLIAIRDRNVAATYSASRTLGQRLNAAAVAMSLLAGLLAVHILRQPAVLRREVERRTQDLTRLNAHLAAEVGERLQAEKALRESEVRLEKRVVERTAALTEANAALRTQHDELKRMHRQLEETHGQLLQSEKMASIGQLAAGIAHEINNPIGFVNSNLGSLKRYLDMLLELLATYERTTAPLPGETAQALEEARRNADIDFLTADVAALLAESLDGVARVKRIVQDLKDFSHVDRLDWQEADLHQGLDSTLNVVWNELKYKADIVKEYGRLPPVECLASQLNQVFMNLLVNAAQAIAERGTITIRTGVDAEHVWIDIADTGRGIAPEHLSRIFEPFFTTKPVGKGTGLGLSISYGIVKKHGGSIAVASTPGQGSSFRITLPRRREAAAAAAAGESALPSPAPGPAGDWGGIMMGLPNPA